jgi:hypothetical protein
VAGDGQRSQSIDLQEQGGGFKQRRSLLHPLIFKFASSRRQPDTFSLARYSDMKSKLVNIPPLDDNDPSLH